MTRSGQIQLVSGRILRLGGLRQWLVYSGLLEGLPTVEMNTRIIDSLLAEERDRWGCESYLISSEQQPIEYSIRERYPFGEPASLPEIGCVAYYTSDPMAVELGDGFSALVVIWFQDEYAFPIDPVVSDRLRSLPWKQHATDREY